MAGLRLSVDAHTRPKIETCQWGSAGPGCGRALAGHLMARATCCTGPSQLRWFPARP